MVCSSHYIIFTTKGHLLYFFTLHKVIFGILNNIYLTTSKFLNLVIRKIRNKQFWKNVIFVLISMKIASSRAHCSAVLRTHRKVSVPFIKKGSNSGPPYFTQTPYHLSCLALSLKLS